MEGRPGWAVEVKMLRLKGHNNGSNDNMLLHLLSPYPKHRIAITDCAKIGGSGFAQRKAVMIFGYEDDEMPLIDAIYAFEVLANQRIELGPRHEASFKGLIHPVHAAGCVYSWQLLLS